MRPLTTLSRVAVLLAGAWGLLSVAMASAAPVAAEELLRGRTGAAASGYGMLGIGWSLVALAGFVASCLWLWRARHNTLALDPQATHKRHQLWVWFGWVMPVLQLWIPYQVVRDVARTSGVVLPPWLLPVWWTAWLLGLYSGGVASQLLTEPDSPSRAEALGYFPQVAGFSAVTMVIAMACWIVLLRRITTAQAAS